MRTNRSQTNPSWAVAARVILIVIALAVGSAATVAPEGISGKIKPDRAIGTVEVILPANGSPMGEKPALVELEWFGGTADTPARGTWVLSMLDALGQPKRVITAEVTDHPSTGVVIDLDLAKAWYVGEVVSDVKMHAGCDGHDGSTDGGCSGGDGTTDGGCSDHDVGTTGGGSPGYGGGSSPDDGGCSGHDDGTTDGGCSGGDGATDGGCSGGDGTTDGGCSGHDDGTTEGGCAGGSGGSGGVHVSGKDSRVGQLIVVKIHDVATPGSAGDGITWKWFSGDSDFAPSISDVLEDWPHLCKKEIVEGNLVVHR
jgi:hypothetical protein